MDSVHVSIKRILCEFASFVSFDMLSMDPRYFSITQYTLYTVSDDDTYTEYQAYAHLASGLSVGLSALGAGMAIGIVGDAGVRANGQQPKLFVGMILILIFAEALGLYGLIVAIVLSQK